MKKTTKDPFDFVHIGLGKCASTSLQSHWAQSRNYEYLSANEIAKVAGDLVETPSFNEGMLPALNIGRNQNSGKFRVLSSEGMSWGFLNEVHKQSLIPKKQKVVAQILSKVKFSRKLFIIVRDPISWIKSAHAQSINQGRFENLSTFIEYQRKFIEGVLNLDYLLSTWKQYSFDIVILPLEMLTFTAADFWSQYEEKLNVQRPSSVTEKTLNKVLANRSDKSKLYHHAKLNELIWTIEKSLRSSEDYARNFSKEQEGLINAVEKTRQWGVRRFINFGNIEDIEGNLSGVNQETAAAFLNFSIDDDLRRLIKTNFIGTLESGNYLENKYIEKYKKNLDLGD